MKTLPYKEILKTLSIFALGFAIIVVVAQTTNKLFNQPPVAVLPAVGTTSTRAECPNDYGSYASTTKRVTLLENRLSNGAGDVLKGYKVTLERTGLTSDIACGYLSYQVSFAGKPIEQRYMALVMRPTASQFGGHILPDEKKGAIVEEKNNKTQVLLPLELITYDGLNRDVIKEANWTALLNVTEQIEFEIALSADSPKGNIDSVQIAYKCTNKETQSETDVCDLKVLSVQPFGF